MKEGRIWNLIGKQLAGEATAEELAELEHWLHSLPNHALLYQSVRAYWQNKKKIPDSDAWPVWYAIEQKINQNDTEESTVKISEKHRFYLTFKVAAAATLLLLAAWFLFQYGEQTLLNFTATVQENAKGIRSKIMLPDGSLVWLNTESKLTYHQDFGETIRAVYLSGEAFFEVEKNPEVPFIIYLEKNHIQVMGTSFNVKSYENEKTVETSVMTGEVLFVKKGTGAEKKDSVYYITPNQKLAFFKDSGHVEKIKVNSQEDIAWIQGKLIFKNETWDQIAKTLERTYDTTIAFENPSLRNCRLTATFQEKTLREVLELIAMTEDFNYEIRQQVLIKGKGCVSDKVNK